MSNSQARFACVMGAYVVVGVGTALLATKFDWHSWEFWAVGAVAAGNTVVSKLSPSSVEIQDKSTHP